MVRIGVIALVATTVIAAWLMLSRKRPELRPQPRPETVIPVHTVTLVEQSASRPIRLHGEVTARRSTELRAEVTGIVQKLSAVLERGTRVSAGVELVTIDPRDYEIARDRASAALASARARLKSAELSLEWTRVVAPVGGRISDSRADVGNLISGGTSS